MRIMEGLVLAVLAGLAVPAAAAQPKAIDEVVAACRAAGNDMVPGKSPIVTGLKSEASLIGMAYLNYIYENDSTNQHFCEAMLLMHAQVPAGTANNFVGLFLPEHAAATMDALADVQLSFDYSIARSDPPAEKLEASLAKLRAIVN